MKKFAPFLKLYTDYVKNFDHAMDTIKTWTEKSPDFALLLQALQVHCSFDLLTFLFAFSSAFNTVNHSGVMKRVQLVRILF